MPLVGLLCLKCCSISFPALEIYNSIHPLFLPCRNLFAMYYLFYWPGLFGQGGWILASFFFWVFFFFFFGVSQKQQQKNSVIVQTSWPHAFICYTGEIEYQIWPVWAVKRSSRDVSFYYSGSDPILTDQSFLPSDSLKIAEEPLTYRDAAT